jgi:hypothetical protein
MRFMSDKPMTPKLPGLSDDQIEKIYMTDTSLRSRHIQIEGDMTDEERDVARVSDAGPIERESLHYSRKIISSSSPIISSERE